MGMKMQYTPMKVSQKCHLPSVSFIIRPYILGIPEVGAGEDAEDGRDAHHEVEVRDHEVRAVQVDVDRGLRQEEAAQASADEDGNEPQTEQRRSR